MYPYTIYTYTRKKNEKKQGRIKVMVNISICGKVIRLLLKYIYYIYCVSAPSLHRKSTESLIVQAVMNSYTMFAF